MPPSAKKFTLRRGLHKTNLFLAFYQKQPCTAPVYTPPRYSFWFPFQKHTKRFCQSFIKDRYGWCGGGVILALLEQHGLCVDFAGAYTRMFDSGVSLAGDRSPVPVRDTKC